MSSHQIKYNEALVERPLLKHGKVGTDHMEFKIHDPSLKERSFSGASGSKTATGQHQAAAIQQAKGSSVPGKSNPSIASSKYGLFSKPAKQQAMFEAASYLEQEKPKAINFEPKNTIKKMIKHAAGNFIKNTIATEVTPIVNLAEDLAEKNLMVGSLLVGGASAKLSYEAMSLGSRVIAGKALLGGAQGVFGSVATGSDFVDSAWGGVIGAALGTLNLHSIVPVKISGATESLLLSGLSNLGGQFVEISRNPSTASFNKTSLAFSLWGGGMSGFMTQDITIPLTKAVIESTIQEPINGIGSHIGVLK